MKTLHSVLQPCISLHIAFKLDLTSDLSAQRKDDQEWIKKLTPTKDGSQHEGGLRRRI